MKFSNFHTTALCSPTRASLLTGRNATTNGMATIAEFASGFPGISTRIPFESGFISEVLAEHGYNTYCVGKWHLTPGEECNLAAFKGRWPLGRGFERFYGWLGGETNSYFPDLVHDNHPIEPPARPEDGYHLADDLADKAVEFIRDAKVIDPDKPFFMYLAPQAGHAPHLVPLEWADRYKGVFDEGYEAIRAGILERQIELGLLPEGTELSPINPHGEPEPHRSRRPALAAARHRPPVGHADRRREAAVHPDGRGLRRLHLLLRRPPRPGPRLPRGVGPARQHASSSSCPTTAPAARAGPNGRFNEWRFFNGVPDTAETHPAPHRRAGHPGVEQPLQHRLGLGLRHAVPLLEAVGRRRGRRGRHVPRVVAGEDRARRTSRATSTSTPSTSCRPSTTCSASSRPRCSRATRSSPSRARASPPPSPIPTAPGTRDAVLHDARAALDLPRGLAGLHRAPAAERLGQLRPGRVGAVPPRDRPVPDDRTWPPRNPSGSSC